MKLDRREVLKLSAASVAAGAAGMIVMPQAAMASVDDAIKAFTGGAEVATGKVDLSAPQIAENGNTVPIEVSVESPMTDDDYVESVMILAAGNPTPNVATFSFTPMSGEAAATTRIRLAKTQDVIAIAKMSNGSFFKEQKTVKVTIGGCGG